MLELESVSQSTRRAVATFQITSLRQFCVTGGLINYILSTYTSARMSGLKVTSEKVVPLCGQDIEVRKAYNMQGGLLYAKFIKIGRIDELGISECLEFNKAVLGQLDEYLFPQHFLQIEEEVTNQSVTGFVTQAYETRLDRYVKANKIKEKEALLIFDQVIKAIYSLHIAGFATKSLRSEHFVLCNKTWKLGSLIYANEYLQASGSESEYLWSPKYQAPECFGRDVFSDEEFEPMLVWNLGCMLLELLISTHKFSTLDAMNKIKGQAFSFQALGMKQSTWQHFSEEVQQALALMLHYNPKNRTSLAKIFQNQFLSPEVAKKCSVSPVIPIAKLDFGKSSVRTNQLSNFNSGALDGVSKELDVRKKEVEQVFRSSRLDDEGLNDLDFGLELNEMSMRIPARQGALNGNRDLVEISNKSKLQSKLKDDLNGIGGNRMYTPTQDNRGEKDDVNNHYTQGYEEKQRKADVNNHYTQGYEEKQKRHQKEHEKEKEQEKQKYSNIEELMECKSQLRSSLQLYKSYYDQSELLVQSAEIIKQMEFPSMKKPEVGQLKTLIKYAITLFSYINLHAIAQGFNQNRNIYSLPADSYILFTESPEYSSLQKFVNFKRNDRGRLLEEIRAEIRMMKVKPILTGNPFVSDMVNVDHKNTSFQKIKSAYRFIVKQAYDRISQEYNDKKRSEASTPLSRIAMYVTYCLTTDKLYIKEDIADNFKFFFEWSKTSPSSYVPIQSFKQYLKEAPKEMLIENSRFILKKYYNL